jgi:hypothetical protein
LNVPFIMDYADRSLRAHEQQWRVELGELVYANTLADLQR